MRIFHNACGMRWGTAITLLVVLSPLVNVYITMERITIFYGKTHYKWQFSIAMLKLPEGNFSSDLTDGRGLFTSCDWWFHS